MVAAGTLHAMAVEMTVGSLVLATSAALLRTLMVLSPSLSRRLGDRVAGGLDGASLYGAILGLVFIPATIITGILAAGDGNSLTSNKMLLSGLCVGLWLGFLHGRITLGPSLWANRPLAILQGAIAIVAFLVTMTLSSIGGELARGETVTDLIPIFPDFAASPEVGMVGSILMLILGVAALCVVLFVQPKARRLPDE
jgi:hypothetical protein